MLSLALVTGLALTSIAQDTKGASATTEKKQHTPEEQAKKSTEWAVKNLGLDADQKTKWQAAVLERATANAPLHEKMKGATTPEDRKAARQQVKGNMEKFNTTVNTFLNADQKTKWEKFKADKKAKHDAKKDGKKGTEEFDLEPEK